MSWKLIPKLEFKGGSAPRLEKLVLFKQRKGVSIYIPAKMKKELHNPKYYNLYVKGTVIMLQFTNTVESYTRKISSNGSIRLPMSILEFSLKPIVRESLESEIQNGNLFIDLKPFIKEKK